jgi:hypothetical protein
MAGTRPQGDPDERQLWAVQTATAQLGVVIRFRGRNKSSPVSAQPCCGATTRRPEIAASEMPIKACSFDAAQVELVDFFPKADNKLSFENAIRVTFHQTF